VQRARGDVAEALDRSASTVEGHGAC
jgi:hypothetical protein